MDATKGFIDGKFYGAINIYSRMCLMYLIIARNQRNGIYEVALLIHGFNQLSHKYAPYYVQSQ